MPADVQNYRCDSVKISTMLMDISQVLTSPRCLNCDRDITKLLVIGDKSNNESRQEHIIIGQKENKIELVTGMKITPETMKTYRKVE